MPFLGVPTSPLLAGEAVDVPAGPLAGRVALILQAIGHSGGSA
jgi:hypothetical protein